MSKGPVASAPKITAATRMSSKIFTDPPVLPTSGAYTGHDRIVPA